MLSKLLAIRVARRYKSMNELILDFDDFEQRRQLVERRQQRPKETPAVKDKSLPGWILVAAGAGLIATIAIVLYFSGAFG